MMWPEKPTCHGEAPRFAKDGVRWDPPEVTPSTERDGFCRAQPFRTCSYCGSIHPEDLFNYLVVGQAKLGGSDWKYGWPHKFYVSGIPNPLAGQQTVRSARYEGEKRELVWSAEPFTAFAKWYNKHLLDLTPDTFTAMAEQLEKHAGIRFAIEDGKLRYWAPYRGYQRA